MEGRLILPVYSYAREIQACAALWHKTQSNSRHRSAIARHYDTRSLLLNDSSTNYPHMKKVANRGNVSNIVWHSELVTDAPLRQQASICEYFSSALRSTMPHVGSSSRIAIAGHCSMLPIRRISHLLLLIGRSSRVRRRARGSRTDFDTFSQQ